ncbi:MAG: YraN family protein [Oscillospiraceae bacterium]|jgi:putative endonuclease|nr:YraN family protein [Oscillospiraceae bacterium]
MLTQKQIKGKLGEDAAARHLESRGFVLLCRNYHTRYGEVDIIARDAQYLLFVEVKARGVQMWGTPAEAVTPEKQRKIIFAAQQYMQKNPLDLQPRFDAAEVYLNAAGVPRKLRWIQHAFETE